MKIAQDILLKKGNQVWSIHPDATVFEALKLMAEKGVGALIVMDAGQVVGIFSERDYARKVVLQGKSSKDTLVKEIMSSKVLFVGPEQTIEECMALMTEMHIRHLPVLRTDELLGVISIGDVVKAIITDREFVIEQLERYITGTGHGR
jgi:CBS domain-containing protein